MDMLDFSKVKKHFLNITMADGSVFLVCMPKKATYERYLAQQAKNLETAKKLNGIKEGDEAALEALSAQDILEASDTSETFEIASEILSNNKQGKNITADALAHIFDLEDIGLFFKAFSAFVNKVGNDPN